jgi:hypothetical protein
LNLCNTINCSLISSYLGTKFKRKFNRYLVFYWSLPLYLTDSDIKENAILKVNLYLLTLAALTSFTFNIFQHAIQGLSGFMDHVQDLVMITHFCSSYSY